MSAAASWVGRDVVVTSGPHTGARGRITGQANPVATAGPLILRPAADDGRVLFVGLQQLAIDRTSWRCPVCDRAGRAGDLAGSCARLAHACPAQGDVEP